MDFRPFQPLMPRSDLVSRVISQPYDVMSRDEAKAMAGEEPLNFLRVTRAEIGLDGVDSHDESVYQFARQELERLVSEGALEQAQSPVYAIYRQTRGARSQVGIVGLASVAEYEAGLIKKHELTRADKEDDRTHHIDTTEAQTGPVFLAMRSSVTLRTLCERETLRKPDREAWLESSGVRHEAWLVTAESTQGQLLAKELAQVDAFYIADGHHRAASAWRTSQLRHAQGLGEGPWDRFLAVVFPAEWLEILAYNRVVADLNGLTVEGFKQALSNEFDLSGPGAPSVPAQRHQFSMFLDGQWYTLTARNVDDADVIESLDVALLQSRVLDQILGIKDVRRDSRIEFIGGVRGVDALEDAVKKHGGVAFSMFPTALSELFAVSDLGQIMPPKSTWFEPKLADGLFVHRIAR